MRRASIAIVLATFVVACGGTLTLGGVRILRYGPQAGSPAALASGTLRFLDGCVILENLDPNGAPTGQVILWPPGTDLRLIGGQIYVVVGDVHATDGDKVTLGGGEYSDQAWVEHLVGDVGRCRSDLYWLASEMTLQSGASGPSRSLRSAA